MEMKGKDMKSKKNKKKLIETPVVEKQEELVISKVEQDYENRPVVNIVDRYDDNSVLVSITGGCGEGIYELSVVDRPDIISLTWHKKDGTNDSFVWVSDTKVLVQDLKDDVVYYFRAKQAECPTYESSRIGDATTYASRKSREAKIREYKVLRDSALALFEETVEEHLQKESELKR